MPGVLSSVKAEPTDPVRGFLNDMIDVVGFPRPEDSLGTPADIVHQFGLPTVKEWLPMPMDVNGRMTKGFRDMLPAPPRPPNPMSIFSLVGFPGEGLRDATRGEREARAIAGYQGSPKPNGDR